jgi:hypothetical protein
MRFRLVQILSPGLLVFSRDGEPAMWDRAKLRRKKDCASCGRHLTPGEEVFSPMGNTSYRYERLCLACVETMRANFGRREASR